MTAAPLIIPVARFFTISGGAALAGGKVYTYETGTNTPKVTYKDYTANPSDVNTNPVILDSSGSANIWLDGNYRINLTDSNDVQQANYPVDGVSSFISSSVSEYALATGTANNYIITPSPSATGYTAGQSFSVMINATNTGPSTINVSALGTQSIVKLISTPLTGGELVAGTIYRLIYDGTNFQILSSSIYGFESASIASAGTVNLGAVTGAYAHITGTTTITSFGTAPAGAIRYVTFDGVLTLTYNATSLILPGAANITTVAGDTLILISEGAGNWRCVGYNKSTGGVAGNISSSNGMIAQTGTGTYAGRTITAGSSKVSITNSDGIAGNPTIDVTASNINVSTSTGGVAVWANFNGVGSATIRGSLNVSSIGYNAAGDYTINFSITFANANYAYAGNSAPFTAFVYQTSPVLSLPDNAGYINKTTTSARVRSESSNGGNNDTFDINLLFAGTI